MTRCRRITPRGRARTVIFSTERESAIHDPAGPPANSSERRIVTALFCDVVGSTTLAEAMDPEDWGEIANQAASIMADCVTTFGGTVAQFAGDSILALFGAPVAHEDDPYRAIRAALAIVSSVSDAIREAAGTEIQVRIGIHTGLVVAGAIEAGSYGTYSALGDTLNVAARLQSEAEPGTILVSEETRSLVASDVEAVEVGSVALTGRKEPVLAYVIESALETEDRKRGLPGLLSPLVGRQAEMEHLAQLLETSAAGTGRVVAILGEPGAGKTRLITEAEKIALATPGALWAMGTCVAFDKNHPYHLVASLVRSLTGISTSDDETFVEASLREYLASVNAEANVETLLRLLAVGEEALDGTDELPDLYSRAVADLVSATAKDHRPLILVLEDAHWADPSSVDLLIELLVPLRATPTLLVIVMRPERQTHGWDLLASARRELGESFSELELQPLDPDSSRTLVSHLLDVDSLPPDLRQLILNKAEGNPFFIEELVRMLIDGEVIERQGDSWVAVGDVGELSVPQTLHGLLSARIDQIPPDVKRTGRLAAVIGRAFSNRLVHALQPTDTSDHAIHPDIAVLESSGVVRLQSTTPELTFAFRHALIHDVMYEGILNRERRELHLAVAEALEALYPERGHEYAPTLAHHFEKARELERSIPYFLDAARGAMSQGAHREAHHYYAEAHQAVEASSSDRPQWKVDAALGLSRSGLNFIPAHQNIAWLQQAIPVAERMDSPDALAALYIQLIRIRNMQGDSYANSSYRNQLETAYSLVDDITDSAVTASLHGMMGQALRSADEYEKSVGPLTESVAGLEAAGKFAEASFEASMLADSLSTVGRFDEAADAVARAHELGKASGDPNAILDADLIQGRIAAEMGDLETAVEHTRRGLEAADEVGNTFCSLAGNFMVADQQMRLGKVETAISHLEESTGLAEYCNAGGYEALGQAWLAAARARMGSIEINAFDEPLAQSVAAGSRSGEALVRLQRAIAVSGAGNPLQAADDFERAIQLFEEYGGLPNLARAHHAYGAALEAAGDPDKATTHLSHAERLFRQLGITADPIAR